MGQAIAVRMDFTAGEVRRVAKQAKDSGQARRLLAIAAVLEGASREDAAKIGGMDRQTLRDWVIRTVSSTFLHRACRPSSAKSTGPFWSGSWKRARSQRCTVWCAGGRAI